jgi:putative mycofactocin binding protein MftB
VDGLALEPGLDSAAGLDLASGPDSAPRPDEAPGLDSAPGLDEGWTLTPGVALRPEPFGALAYHFGNRRLTFLKRPELVAVVRALASAATVRAALTASGVPERHFPAYLTALKGLADADMIRPRNAP